MGSVTMGGAAGGDQRNRTVPGTRPGQGAGGRSGLRPHRVRTALLLTVLVVLAGAVGLFRLAGSTGPTRSAGRALGRSPSGPRGGTTQPSGTAGSADPSGSAAGATTGGTAAGGSSGSGGMPVTVGSTQHGPVLPSVGVLLDSTGTHFCTASVVDSPRRDLLITAAHCVHGGQGADYRTGLVFVPGYHDGTRPYGSWPVTTINVDPRWTGGSDQDEDVAFVTVAPVGGRQVADVVGANHLVTDAQPGVTVELVGYPDTDEQPLTCAGPTRSQSASQLRIDCPGYTDGTSGGPWLANVDPQTLTGNVVGVIGGFQAGGDTPDTSYSVYFTDDVRQLYSEVS